MRRDVFVAIANDMVGAGVARRLFLGLGADGADHGRADRLQPLDQNQSDSARRGVDEHRPAGLDLRAALDQRPDRASPEIASASCRARVCQYVYISEVAVSIKKKN